VRNQRPIETRRSPVGRPESVASGDSVLVGASPSAKRAKAGFWVLASIFGLFLVASTTPSPLYGVCRQVPLLVADDHHGVRRLRAGPAHYLAGHGSLSDVMGRRPVIFGALGLELVSAALFLVADGVAWLYAGRILQGW
jgi:MFS family permease